MITGGLKRGDAAASLEVSVGAGEPGVLRYRIVVHDGPTPTKVMNTLSEEFRQR